MGDNPSHALTGRSLNLAARAGLLGLGLAALALATLLETGLAILAILASVSLVAATFLGVPARVVDYVQARRGYRYQAFFAIATPLFLVLLMAAAAWLEIDVAVALGTWPWTDIASPALYGMAAVLNLGALVLNIRAFRAGPSA